MRSTYLLTPRFILPLLMLAFGLLLATQPVFAQSAPGAPTDLTATAVGATTAELSWTAPSGTVTGYKIETSVNNGGTWASSVADTEADGANNDGPGVQTYYSVTAAAGENLYRVSAINTDGTGAPSTVASVTPPVDGAEPAAPTTVTAVANGSSEINLFWTAGDAGASSITGYRIEYSKDNSLPWMTVGTTTVTTSDDGTKYSDTSLAPNTTRYYRVSAMNIAGRGPVSDITGTAHMAATAQAGVPAAPTGLTATAVAADRVELSWTAPNEGSAPITGYMIETSGNDGDTWTSSTTNTEGDLSSDANNNNDTVSGVQTYFSVAAVAGKNLYRVSAINALGTGPVSSSASVTPPVTGAQPAAPTTVAARVDGTSEIEVTWTAAAAGATVTTGYKIEYSKDNNLPWMDVATVGNVLKYSNTGLAPGTTRWYRVSAINSIGRGPVSAISGTDHTGTTTTSTPSSVPGKPTGLTAMAVGATTAELSWTAPSGTVTGYFIETSVNDGGTWASSVADTEADGADNDGPGVQTYYSVTAAAGGNLYRVSAINAAGTGAPSTVASVTPPVDGTQPAAPTTVTAVANGSSEINLFWTAGAAGVSPITGYRIEYSKDNSLPWMTVGTTTVTTSDDGTKYSDTSLAPNTTRYYRVSAMNIAGRGPVSDITGTAHMAATALAGVPAAPTGLTATAVAADRVELSWTAPNEGSAPITGYMIETSGNDGDTWTSSTTNTEGDLSSDTNNNNDTVSGVQTYFSVAAVAGKNLYRVSAINALGTGPVSSSASVTPPVDTNEPDAPTTVAARPDGTSEIEVTWTAAAAGATVTTGYKIEYSKDNNLPWMDVATVGNVLRYEDIDLDPDTTRYYRVSAINSIGRGPVSATPAISDAPNTNNTDHVAKTDMGSADQPGTVTLSTQAPMVGTEITATLTDADGMISGQMWQWEKSMDKTSWMDATGAGATTMSYTPAAMDVGYYLRATITYTDKNRSGRMANSMATEMMTVESTTSTLFDRYDANDNMVLDKVEILKAIDDYLNHGTISKEQVLELITLYLSGTS